MKCPSFSEWKPSVTSSRANRRSPTASRGAPPTDRLDTWIGELSKSEPVVPCVRLSLRMWHRRQAARIGLRRQVYEQPAYGLEGHGPTGEDVYVTAELKNASAGVLAIIALKLLFGTQSELISTARSLPQLILDLQQCDEQRALGDDAVRQFKSLNYEAHYFFILNLME
jgi:hypothetical protein